MKSQSGGLHPRALIELPDQRSGVNAHSAVTMHLFLGILIRLLLSALPSTLYAQSYPDAAKESLILWYDKPAAFMKLDTEDGGQYKSLLGEALLIGNGRLGAMIMGGVGKELVYLNENTLWTGGLNPDGDYSKNLGRYQSLGNLTLELTGQTAPSQYRRSLNLKDAISEVTYTARGITFRREHFASHPDQVIVFHLTANHSGSYSGSLTFTDAHGRLSVYSGNRITTPGGFDNNGLRYETQVMVIPEGGALNVDGERFDEKLAFKNCDSLTILVAAGTDYAMDYARRYRSGEIPHVRVTKQLDAAAAQSYEQLKRAHIADYQSLFSRFSVDLGASSPAQRALPTNLRRLQAAKITDPEFDQIACQYGRYLIISSSRAGGVAANGQGIWNDSNCSIWGARYTNDLAPTEMEYWSVESTNLAECHLPLLDLIRSQVPAWRSDTHAAAELKTSSGRLTTRGWETRGNHNIMGGQSHFWNKGGSAWYCNHFWEHYAFSQNRGYLKNIVYPLLKETCEFWEDHLKTLPDGRLVVPNFWSPEHGPWGMDGVSYSQELVWDVFTNYVDACDVLGVDREYRARVVQLRDKLLTPGVGSWGQLLEWMTEMKNEPSLTKNEKRDDGREGHIDTPLNSHRHTSHLLGVYPLRQISYERTPELAAAAKVSLVARDNGLVDYAMSCGARAPIYARLYEGDMAYARIQKIYAILWDNLMMCDSSGSYSLPAACAEMLLQSHRNNIHILPALPKAWTAGSVKGLRARGGYEVDESWRDGRLTSLAIRSVAGHAVDVCYGNKTVKVDLRPGGSVSLDADLQAKN